MIGTITKECAMKDLIKIGDIVDQDLDLKRAGIEQNIEIVESIAVARSQEIRGQKGARKTATASHIKVIGEERGTHQADLLLLSVVELAKIRCYQNYDDFTVANDDCTIDFN